MSEQPHKLEETDKWIGDIVGVFTDPIIVMPGGWGDSLPESLKSQVTLERLIENVKGLKPGAQMMASDAEAACYLYTASLMAPMGHDWTQIYLYVAGKVMSRIQHKGPSPVENVMPEDIRVEKLTPQQERELTRLKVWIYEARLKARRDRTRGERKEDREKTKKSTEPEAVQTSFKF